MTIEQGSTFNLLVYWKNSANNPIDMTNYTAKMQIRSSTGASVKLLEISSDSGEIEIYPLQGSLNVKIGYLQTQQLEPSVAVYDLELYAPTGEVYKLLKGRVRIEGEVTR